MFSKLFGFFSKNRPQEPQAPQAPASQVENALTAENASAQAQLAVTMVKKLDGATLDFSPGSLRDIDRILEGFHNNGDTSEKLMRVTMVLGCYVGEVMIRNLKCKWVNSADTPAASIIGGNLPLAQFANGYLANPIGKVAKAIDNGSEDSICYFYDVSQQRA